MTEKTSLFLNATEDDLSTLSDLIDSDALNLSDEELLNLVLKRAVTNKETTPVAAKLLEHFGTISKVIGATPDALRETGCLDEEAIAFLMLVHGACETIVTPHRTEKVVLDNFEKLVDYLRVKLAPKPVEYIYAIYLDEQCQVIVSEELRCGYETQVPIYPQEILQHALNAEAHHVVLVHNHPSGDALPSRRDVELTGTIEKMLSAVDIRLYDHLIISFEKIYSIRSRSYLPYRLNG